LGVIADTLRARFFTVTYFNNSFKHLETIILVEHARGAFGVAPVISWIVRHTPRREPKFHSVEMFEEKK
jgi:hypothetical protein